MVGLLRKDRISTSIGLVFSLLIAQRVVSFVRGIVFARLLGTEHYGIYTLGFFLILLAVSVTSLGIPASFTRYAPRYEAKGGLRSFFRKAYVLNIVVGVAVATVVLLLPSVFSDLVYGNPSQTSVMIAVGLSIPGLVVIRNLASSFAGLKLFRASSVLELSQVAVYAVLGTILVVLNRSASVGLLAYAASMFVCIPLFAPLLAKYLRQLEPVYSHLSEPRFYRYLLRFTVWFTVTPILVHIFHYVDRLSLQRLMSSSDQGIYSAAINLGATISAVGLAINSVIFPHLSATWERGEREEALRHLDLTIRVAAVALAAIGLILVVLARPIIVVLLGNDYAAGARVLPLLVTFYLFTISVWLFGVYPALIERTYVSAIGLACALPVNVILNIVLIPRLGIVGAALATMVSYFVMWCIIVMICAAFGMPVSRRTVIVSLLPFLLLLPKALALGAVGAAAYICARTTWILPGDERQTVYAEVRGFLTRLRRTSH